MISRILWFGFVIGLVVNFAGQAFLPPQIVEVIRNNRMMSFGAVFLCQMFASQILQTGAFEVELDGELIFSKLKTGEAPNLPGLLHLIQQRLGH